MNHINKLQIELETKKSKIVIPIVEEFENMLVKQPFNFAKEDNNKTKIKIKFTGIKRSKEINRNNNINNNFAVSKPPREDQPDMDEDGN